MTAARDRYPEASPPAKPELGLPFRFSDLLPLNIACHLDLIELQYRQLNSPWPCGVPEKV